MSLLRILIFQTNIRKRVGKLECLNSFAWHLYDEVPTSTNSKFCKKNFPISIKNMSFWCIPCGYNISSEFFQLLIFLQKFCQSWIFFEFPHHKNFFTCVKLIVLGIRVTPAKSPICVPAAADVTQGYASFKFPKSGIISGWWFKKILKI